MIFKEQTKSIPITKMMVWDAYKKVKSNKGSAGVDQQTLEDFDEKGKTPVRKTMAKRISLNMISTITNQGKVRFMTYEGTMNAQRFIVFLKRLTKGSTRKIYLILDNLKVHHSKIVKAWIEKNTEEIELFYLPSYSPEINPDEYLNNDLKSGIGLKPTPKNHKQMKSNVKSHMIFLQKNSKRVARFFHHKSIKYAAA